MIAYVGQTRSRALVAELGRLGIGECTVTGELPARRSPFFHDNGAFRDFEAGRPFSVNRWMRDMRWLSYRSIVPDFVVVPDLVGGGAASLAMSTMWRDLAAGTGPAYLAVQNGMDESEIAEVIVRDNYAGIFVGGDLPWKLATAPAWIRLAHDLGLRCHVGRVGPPDRVEWARSIGAESIDSSLPVMHEKHLRSFLVALGVW